MRVREWDEGGGGERKKYDSRLNGEGKRERERDEYGINHRFYAVIKQQKSIFLAGGRMWIIPLHHDFASPRLEIWRKAPSQVAKTVSCPRIYLRLINKRRQASIRTRPKNGLEMKKGTTNDCR